jgi:hypothetical protein
MLLSPNWTNLERLAAQSNGCALPTPILAESSTPPFFCHSFSWALLQANSCVRRVSAFPVPSLNPMGPSIKQPLALEAEALASGCPRKMGQEKGDSKNVLPQFLFFSSGRRIIPNKENGATNRN